MASIHNFLSASVRAWNVTGAALWKHTRIPFQKKEKASIHLLVGYQRHCNQPVGGSYFKLEHRSQEETRSKKTGRTWTEQIKPEEVMIGGTKGDK